MKVHVSRMVTLVAAALVAMVMFLQSAHAAPTSCAEGLCDEKQPALPDKLATDNDFVDMDEDGDIAKRLSKFVRIGKGHSSFVRIGRPHAFVRIGKSTDDSAVDPDFSEADKRGSNFVRIGKGMNRFLRIGKSVDSDKRANRFMRIGKSVDDGDDMEKRAHAFVRIGKIPSSAFVRIGREPLLDQLMKKPSSNFLRIGRMGSSFVRIGKKSVGQDEEVW